MKHLLLILILVFAVYPQNSYKTYFEKNGEMYFKFPVQDRGTIDRLGTLISIDNVRKDTVFAYANKEEFEKFLTFNIPYETLRKPGDVPFVKMSDNLKDIQEWDSYPTYEAYVAMMYQFQTQYPTLCRIVEIGTTVQGRKLLFAKITDNPDINEPEPEFQYTSSIHGDETTGYVLMLRLINYLLSNYETNMEIADIVNNTEIWINPLANPDGTYKTGNSTVNGAVRSNANNVDMNRNFPDPVAGQHPDGKQWQPETIAMMNFMKSRNFVLSANFHGGVEVLNFPWDTWAQIHPDDAWLRLVSRAYADTVHRYAPSTYMTYLENGITNGYAWYRVTGGRQDYFTYFMRGREITMEISNTKLLPAAQLPNLWNYNYRSLVNYMKWVYYGINGIIKDQNGNPVKAKISIQGHENNNSDVMSDSVTGDYYRLIAPGTYTVIVAADSFETKTIPNVIVNSRASTSLNINLNRIGNQNLTVNVSEGWNIVSVPLIAPNMTKTSLFPNAVSGAYGYNSGYTVFDTLTVSKGYWLKYATPQTLQISGTAVVTNNIPVQSGWNLIGPFNRNIPVSQITSTPSGIIASEIFGYSAGYFSADTLKSGQGYWIKCSGSGVLNLPVQTK